MEPEKEEELEKAYVSLTRWVVLLGLLSAIPLILLITAAKVFFDSDATIDEVLRAIGFLLFAISTLLAIGIVQRIIAPLYSELFVKHKEIKELQKK